MSQIPKIVVLLETSRVFDRQLLSGIGQYARLHGPWLFHIVSHPLECGRLPANWRDCSGVIARLSSPNVVAAVNATNAPVVVVDGVGDPLAHQLSNRVGDVSADSHGVARIAARYFASRGFAQLAFVGTPNREFSNLGRNSFGEVARQLGLPLFVYPMLHSPELAWIEERVALAKWLEDLPKPIGLLTCDDERGLQVLEACRSARVAVPDQVAVVSVGNDELICDLANPSLSSIGLAAVPGGCQAAHVLDQALRHARLSHQQVMVQPNNVVVRASTDVDASQDPHVNAARGIIRREFCHDFSVDALAKTVGVSRRVLEMKFRKHTGNTIWEEVQVLRIARAKMILKETALPIVEVASLSGYRSASHLVQLFARETGLTPAKYRIAARDAPMHQKNHWPIGDLGRGIA